MAMHYNVAYVAWLWVKLGINFWQRVFQLTAINILLIFHSCVIQESSFASRGRLEGRLMKMSSYVLTLAHHLHSVVDYCAESMTKNKISPSQLFLVINDKTMKLSNSLEWVSFPQINALCWYELIPFWIPLLNSGIAKASSLNNIQI